MSFEASPPPPSRSAGSLAYSTIAQGAVSTTASAQDQLIVVNSTNYEKLTPKNFSIWEFQWNSGLNGLGLSRFIQIALPDDSPDSRRRQDALIHSAMVSSITPEVIQFILHCNTTYTLWTTLKGLYGRPSKAALISTREMLSNLQKGDMSMSQYLMEIKRLVFQLTSAGVTVSDDELLYHIQHGLPSDYDSILGGFHTRDQPVPFEELHEKLIAAELSLTRRAAHQQALGGVQANAASVGKSGSSSGGSPYSAGSSGSLYTGRHKGGDGQKWTKKGKVVCQFCDKPGHVMKTCRKWLALVEAFNGFSVSGGANSAAGVRNPRANFASHGSSGGSPWLVDSGASHHVSQDLDNLAHHTPYDGSEEVHLGDGNSHCIANTGSTLLSSSSKPLALKNILHVPNFTKSLISVHKLCSDNSVSVEFDSSHFVVQDKRTGAKLVKGLAKDGVYYWPNSSRVSSLQPLALSASLKPSVWHNRLGHPSSSVLRLVLKSLGRNVSLKHSFHCESCKCAKMHRLPFATSTIKSVDVLDYIYSDVWGPSPVTSADGSKFYVLFVDHFTRYMWIFPLFKKSDVFDTFVSFKKAVEKLFAKQIKHFYSDNGGEFVKLKPFFESNGIEHLLTPPYTPQHNAISERRHRHVVETGLSLLHSASLPLRFWSYAFKTAVYLINRLPTPVLDNDSPFERLFHQSPSYEKLRSFGCLCYPLLRPYNDHKLQYRSAPCIFLGYASHQSAFLCYNWVTSKLFVTRHVHFVEHIFPFKQIATSSPRIESSRVMSWSPSVEFLPLHASAPFSSGDTVSSSTPSPTPNAPVVPPPSQATDSPTSTSFPAPATSSSGQQPLPSHAPSSSGESPVVLSRPVGVEVSNDTLSLTNISQTHTNTHPMITRGKANIKKPIQKLCLTTMLNESSAIPRSITTALSSPHWNKAMIEELAALHNRKTWSLVPPPPGVKPVACKWVYRIKYNSDGSIARYKARLVAKGFLQRPGLDFFETFSPVAKHVTVRIIIALAVSQGWVLRQIDVNNAFLHGTLKEKVYMAQPPGFVDSQFPNHVCEVHQALYGLKQAPRAWYTEFSEFLLSIGFYRSQCDHCLFALRQNKSVIFLVVYVDDIIITGTNPHHVRSFIITLGRRFSIKDLGDLNYFLGIEVIRCNDGIILSQKKYILELLKTAGMLESKPTTTPLPLGQTPGRHEGQPLSDPSFYRTVIGSLQYLNFTRPDIAFSVNKLAQFSSAPTDIHWQLAKRILRYLAGTVHHGLFFPQKSSMELHAFSDSDWAGDKDDRTSTSAYVIFLGASPISWVSKKQKAVSRSSTEAEYRAIATTASEVRWIQILLAELRVDLGQKPVIYCDNLSALHTTQNPVFHSRVRHIEIDFHFVRNLIASGYLRVSHVPTKDQLADLLTKSLPKATHNLLRSKIGLRDRSTLLRGHISDKINS